MTPRRPHRTPALWLTAAMLATMAATPAAAAAAETTQPVEAGIVVTKVANMPDQFYAGVDVSSALSLEASGVVFRDEAGNRADLFEVLADAGVNSVRVRVWNNPFDAQGRGYGGGTVDTTRGVEIGKRATAAGMSVLVDFHYSDFWADPGKQTAPKAWSSFSGAQKATAAHDFTAESLRSFKAAGVDVEMVQVGNETNGSVAGVTAWSERAAIFQAGSTAVRSVYPGALVAVHYTNPERAGFYASVAAELARYGVDYDVFASSYYPFWHGTPENLTSVLSHVAAMYDKKIMVAETSWVRTLEEGDGHPNVIRTAQTAYPVSVQGQATAVRDVIQAVANVPNGAGIGVYYWEPAWLPVGPPSQWESNRVLWERDGSGWASSYAGTYDPTGDTAAHYGGSAWENQALFDYQGNPQESLNVFSYARTGATAPREVVSVQKPSVTVTDGQAVTLPPTVAVAYNTGQTEQVPVTWSGAQDWIRGAGTYAISGSTSAGPTTASVTVHARTLVANAGFESGTTSWTISGTGAGVNGTDPFEGSRSLHFYSGSAYAFTAAQTVTGVPAGDYVLSANGQGDAMGGSLTLGATTGTTTSKPFTLAGWRAWSTPTVPVTVGDSGTVVVRIAGNLPAGAWGTVDQVVLTRVAQSSVDRSTLASALDEARRVERARYTAESLTRLDSAVEIGTVVAAGSIPSQSDVDRATALVRAAIDGLVEPDTTAPSVSASVSGRSVTVTATDAGSGVATVEYRLDGGGWTTYTAPVVVDDAAHTLTYRATDTAGNASSVGTVDVPAVVHAPGAPTEVTVTTGDRIATVSWTAPASTGGAPITGYTVTAAPGGQSCTTTGALSCRVDGLANGTSYTFGVTATNEAGTSGAGTSAPVTPSFAPGGTSTAITVSAKAHCVNGKPSLTVSVASKESVKVDVRVSTALGAQKVTNLAPGAARNLTFPTTTTDLTAGTAFVTADKVVKGKWYSTTYQAGYTAVTCG